MVLLKNGDLIPTFFADEVNAVARCPQALRFELPFQQGYRILEDEKGPGLLFIEGLPPQVLG